MLIGVLVYTYVFLTFTIHPQEFNNNAIMKIKLVILFSLIATLSFAQKDKIYKSFEEALRNPTQVYQIKIAYKNLDSIPADIFNLVNLEKLELNNNDLKTLPPELCSLPNLKVLNLFRNKLISLPENIGDLKKLEKTFRRRRPSPRRQNK